MRGRDLCPAERGAVNSLITMGRKRWLLWPVNAEWYGEWGRWGSRQDICPCGVGCHTSYRRRWPALLCEKETRVLLVMS